MSRRRASLRRGRLAGVTIAFALPLGLAGAAYAISSGATTVGANVTQVFAVTGPASLGFGNVQLGDSAVAPVTVTATSNLRSGYQLRVSRTAFSPQDLPLAIRLSSPAGAGQLLDVPANSAQPIPATAGGLQVGHRAGSLTTASGDPWVGQLVLGPLACNQLKKASYTATVSFRLTSATHAEVIRQTALAVTVLHHKGKCSAPPPGRN